MIRNFKNLLLTDFNNKYIFLFIVIPLALLPASLISGPFLPDLIVSISAIFILTYLFIKKKYNYLKFKSFYIFLIFCLYILITSFFSENVYLSLSETLFYVRFGFFSICIYFILKNFSNFIFYFTISFIITFFILIIDSYIQYFSFYNLTGNYYNGYRLNSFFGEEMKLGSYVARLLPILIGLIFFTFKSNKLKYFLIIFFFINALIVVTLSGERIAFFILVFFTVSFFILIKIDLIYKLLIFLILPILFSLILIFDNSARERMFESTLSLFNNKDNLNYSFISRSHHHSFVTAYNMFLQNKITGIGVKNFRILCNDEKYYKDINKFEVKPIKNDYGCFTHPHNNYIQLLAETGIIGFIFILFLFFSISFILLRHFIYQFIKNKKVQSLDNHQICFYLAIFITIIPFIPSGNLFNNWLSVIYYLPVGFIYYFNEN